MKWRKFIPILAILFCCYISGPCVAGSYRIGDRRGPVVYPESFHELLYIMAHEGSYKGEKPRLSPESWLYSRPILDCRRVRNLNANDWPVSKERDRTGVHCWSD
jgi:hypothetical protein